MDVAVVDFTSPTAPQDFTRSLLETGFGVLVNHPLPAELVQQVYGEWAAFFESPERFEYTETDAGKCGYFPPDVSEIAKGETLRDLKEFFHVRPGEPFPPHMSEATWRYRDIAVDVARTLLGWVEANTPPEVAARFSRPLAQMLAGDTRTLLRVLRYPPLGGDEPEGAVRAAAHEDINLLTVLPASDESGLELLGADGRWHAVPCDPGSIAVNTGEMLEHASGGHYTATKHRVVNPSGEAARRPRMALPLFLQAADDVVMADGRTALELFEQRMRELRGET